jgi:hypothetical protein
MNRWHTLARSSLVSFVCALVACGDSTVATLDGGALDGSTPDAAPTDGGAVDAGPRAVCDAEDAREDFCPVSLCDGPSRWYWDGEACREVTCGACTGADCGTGGASSLADCEAAHAECKPQRCRATGGVWEWWAEECGDYRCGLPPPADCLVGVPACNCGAGRRYDAELGCVTEPMCALVDPLPPDMLCARTGGTWAATCCNSVCGEACNLDCAALACTCGPLEVFDAVRGCVVGQRCVERSAGERCGERTRCGGGTLCCQDCGGAGCFGEPTCRAPSCDADPNTDLCGNNRLAP